MWVAKFLMKGDNVLIGGLCKKYQVSASGYPVLISATQKGIVLYFTLLLLARKAPRLNLLEI